MTSTTSSCENSTTYSNPFPILTHSLHAAPVWPPSASSTNPSIRKFLNKRQSRPTAPLNEYTSIDMTGRLCTTHILQMRSVGRLIDVVVNNHPHMIRELTYHLLLFLLILSTLVFQVGGGSGPVVSILVHIALYVHKHVIRWHDQYI